MSTKNITKATFRDRIMPGSKNQPITLFGWGIDYEFQPESLRVVTAGDIVNKNFPSGTTSNRTFYTAPEYYPPDIGAKAIRTRMGVPDVDPNNPVYRHTNPMFLASDTIVQERLRRV